MRAHPNHATHAGVSQDEVVVVLSAEALDRIAERAARLALQRLQFSPPTSPYLTVTEAAEYLRASPQRVYDLLSMRRLTRFKDGRRVLIRRVDLDAYVAESGSKRTATPLPPSRERGTTAAVSR